MEVQKDKIPLTCHHAVLEEGDVLYIPAFWWHQVSALSNGVSVNIFWGEAGESAFLDKIVETLPFKYWMLNIVEQNRGFDSFERIMARFEESISAFLLKQWHEILTPSHISIIKVNVYFFREVLIMIELEICNGLFTNH